MAFVSFMSSTTGRLIRIVAGIALIALGLTVIDGTAGVVVAVVGIVPLLAGVFNVCLLGFLFRKSPTS